MSDMTFLQTFVMTHPAYALAFFVVGVFGLLALVSIVLGPQPRKPPAA